MPSDIVDGEIVNMITSVIQLDEKLVKVMVSEVISKMTYGLFNEGFDRKGVIYPAFEPAK